MKVWHQNPKLNLTLYTKCPGAKIYTLDLLGKALKSETVRVSLSDQNITL